MRGKVFRGSLSTGVEVKLAPECPVEDVRVGNFVVVEGRRHRFFCLVADVKLEAVYPGFLTETFDLEEDRLAQEILVGDSIFANVCLQPVLMVDLEGDGIPRAVKTIPPHGAPARSATAQDVGLIFGAPDDKTYFQIGTPLEMDVPVCVNLKRLVERCTGVFGKAGTGKTFLTRVLLAGIIKSRQAVNLIFDAHNEYGWESKSEGEEGPVYVKGLKQLFPSEVKIYTLDEESSQRRGCKYDGVIYVGYDQIEPEDIILLNNLLNLNATAQEHLFLLQKKLGAAWLPHLLAAEDMEAFAESLGAHSGALQALKRKLERIERLPFIRARAPYDAVQRLLDDLEAGRHVVLEFGGTPTLGYMLVVNILTKRIHEEYVRRTEEHIALGKGGPRPLVITVEEAHRFLSPQLAKETIFGTIAREMRKFNVTLLLVDQRTSGIDSEVMSQIGTKISCKLDDEADVNNLLSGTTNTGGLKNVLFSLDYKQQALILGHAVPMPVVVRTRNYDEEFYRAMVASRAPGGVDWLRMASREDIEI
ncbi:MAG: hypothetical protein PWP65_1542 [Clostridia bacterium]|nr:hypothetical protein [Clostridia bacterium]